AASDVRKYETSYGQQLNVTLDDGTVVRLGPESRLTIPKVFGMTRGYRAVKIEGTANFAVSKGGTQAFEVRNGPIILVAHGTEFVVRRFSGEPSLVVHVKDGSVEIRVGEVTRNVPKDMSYAVSNTGEMRVPSSDELDETRTWPDGNVTIVGHNLRYVLPQLKRWYGLDIHVEDQALFDRNVFVRAPMNSPKEAIQSVEQSGGVKFTYIGENMAFQDTAAARAAAKGKGKGATKKR